MFRWKDGIYFGRKADGSVRLIVCQCDAYPDVEGPKPEGATVDETIPADEWASIVAAVSHKSGTAWSFESAKTVHG